STLQSPSHVYSVAGTYSVSLTVTGPGGSDTLTRTNYIDVTEPAPVAGFSGTPTSGTSPLTVAFSDASTGVVSSYAWAFGDGGTSTLQNPSHVYS
ncbi:MAG TPA: PKD domain-containing protein, partial [Planctomycetes bacterium]|nr:PKD domain-containing protein [Planctomycetota bacterium]